MLRKIRAAIRAIAGAIASLCVGAGFAFANPAPVPAQVAPCDTLAATIPKDAPATIKVDSGHDPGGPVALSAAMIGIDLHALVAKPVDTTASAISANNSVGRTVNSRPLVDVHRTSSSAILTAAIQGTSATFHHSG